ncbi:MAG: hypothetical protein GXO77_11920 [Calditrichaeota bacterium]|nr:hypothetical protein [Calditrichota bacterium]
MQLSLFDTKNMARNSFRKNLSLFKLDRALNDLDIWKNTFDAPESLTGKAGAVNEIKNKLQTSDAEAVLYLAHLRQNYDRLSFLEPLREEFRFLSEGLDKAIYDRLDKEAFDFIIEELHPAEIFISQNDFKAAVQSVNRYIRSFGEQPFLRELQGFAYSKSGKERESFTAYTFALFNDPLQCKPEYLLPRSYRNKYRFLLKQTGSSENALLKLPFALWEDGKTYIDPEASAYENLLEKRIEKNRSLARNDPRANILQFNYYLYLAETERLRSQRSQVSERLQNLQEQMWKLNPELFSRYRNVLHSFGNL